MASGLDSERLGLVFQSRPDILEGIRAAADSPAKVKLFNNIASFVYDQIQTGSEPAAKRRRVEVASGGPAANGAGSQGGSNGVDASQEEVQLVVKEISVSIPQRKKFEVCFTKNHLYARAPGSLTPAQGIVYTWKDIEYVFYLPVPEKAQVQHNYILFPRGSSLASLKGSAAPDAPEPFLFTVPATAPKQGTIDGPSAGEAETYSDAYHTLLHWALRKHLAAAGSSADIVSTDPAKFHSAIPQSHRPKERAVHVKAFRGSKDGYLFFLESGILWGYKKPLLFIPLDRVAAVSYTSVLQRTFNMVVEVFTGGDGEGKEEVEFAMVDQADHTGIDEYVKRKRLQDGSMADARKAKLQLAENMRAARKEGGEGGGGAGGAEPKVSDLEAAQMEEERRLQDEEDELEEDYNPSSDDDSGGSGESSEEDSDDEEGEDDDEDEEGEEEGEEEEGGEEGDSDVEIEDAAVEEEKIEVKQEVKRGVKREVKREVKRDVKREIKPEEMMGVTQAGLAVHDEDELAGGMYGRSYDDDEMDLEEKFDVVG